jgi:hypothetical protein
MEVRVPKLKRWGVKVTDTDDRRVTRSTLRIEQCFTRIGAELRAQRLVTTMNEPGQPLQFLAEPIKL